MPHHMAGAKPPNHTLDRSCVVALDLSCVVGHKPMLGVLTKAQHLVEDIMSYFQRV